MARTMIPGRSAGALSRTLNPIVFATVSVLGVAALSAVIGIEDFSPLGLIVIYILLFFGSLLALAACILSVVVSYRASAELSFGYTTLPGRNQMVEQLDPETGRTVRAAGEPFLDKPTLAGRISSGVDLSADGHAPVIPSDTNTRRSRWQYFALVISGLGAIVALLIRLGII